MTIFDVEAVKRDVDAARLFRALGTCIEGHASQITTWQDWDGPDDPMALEICLRHQAMHDRVVSEEQESDWSAALHAVVAEKSKLVPYVEGEDAYYGPNIAAWCAGWVYCLIHVHQRVGMPVPAELAAQAHWYERGHWPCSLHPTGSFESAESYVVL